jgi:hypothetical protein
MRGFRHLASLAPVPSGSPCAWISPLIAALLTRSTGSDVDEEGSNLERDVDIVEEEFARGVLAA